MNRALRGQTTLIAKVDVLAFTDTKGDKVMNRALRGQTTRIAKVDELAFTDTKRSGRLRSKSYNLSASAGNVEASWYNGSRYVPKYNEQDKHFMVEEVKVLAGDILVSFDPVSNSVIPIKD